MGPYGPKYPLTGHFYLSLSISLFTFPSESPVREPPQCSLIGSPRAATGLLSNHSFIQSCMSAAGVPRKEPSYIPMWKNIRSLSTEPHASIQWDAAWLTKGIVMTLLSLPQCYAAFGTVPSTLAWVDQSPVSQHASWQPPAGYTLHNCYCLSCDRE
jgi:hypothetical protein